MRELETERLILRPFTLSDLNDFNEYAKQPEVGPNAGWMPHKSLEESYSILKGWLAPDCRDIIFAIEKKSNGKVIGSIGLHADSSRAVTEGVKMLGYVLSRDYWGLGYMTEAVKEVLKYAFSELGAAIISVSHGDFNLRSRRVIEKVGFKYEGALRYSSKTPEGEICCSCRYSMLRDEYEKLL